MTEIGFPRGVGLDGIGVKKFAKCGTFGPKKRILPTEMVCRASKDMTGIHWKSEYREGGRDVKDGRPGQIM